jgi:hypothetical protein
MIQGVEGNKKGKLKKGWQAGKLAGSWHVTRDS